jgi:hypothetical protein
MLTMQYSPKDFKYKTKVDRTRNYQMVSHDGELSFWFYYVSPYLLKKYKEFYTQYAEYGYDEKMFFTLFGDSISMLIFKKTGKVKVIEIGGDYVCLQSHTFQKYEELLNPLKPIHKKYINNQIKLIKIRCEKTKKRSL